MWRVTITTEISGVKKEDFDLLEKADNKRLELKNNTFMDDDGKEKNHIDLTFNSELEARVKFDSVKVFLGKPKIIGRVTIHNCPHTEGGGQETPCVSEVYING